jgi:hypothetical protein
MNKSYLFLGIAIFMALTAGSCKKSAVQENQAVQPEDSGSNETEPYLSYWAAENLKLREEPKTDGKEIQIMQKGTMVQKLDTGDEVTINYITNKWFYVQTESGEKGWCFGGYLAATKEQAVITGYWVDEAKGRLIIYLRSNGEYQSGMLETSGALGDWSYAGGNTIKVDIIGAHYNVLEEKRSFDMPFTIIDANKVQFEDTVYRRMTDRELKKYGIR